MLSTTAFFKCLSDETRLRCLILLQQNTELCVCELTYALELSQPKISRHLAQLRQCHLLLDSRRGQWVYYKINPEAPSWAIDILKSVSTATKENSHFREDFQRLQSMSNRPDASSCCS